MFYQTQVKSIIQGGVVDVHGKTLSLIGNKLVKQGDFIWTDGKVVFGHTPIRGGGILYAEQSGIPILANNLRGYFNLNGDFKSYNIAGDAWIVNDKKFYAHDEDDADIIDADFADNGELFTAQKIITNFAEPDEDFLYCAYDRNVSPLGYRSAVDNFSNKQLWSSIWQENSDYLLPSKDDYFFTASKDDYIMRDGNILRQCEISIKSGDKNIQRIFLSDLVKYAEDIARSFVDIAQHPTFSPEEHIKSRARLHNFKINHDGSWVAIVEARIFAERGFWTYTFTTTRNYISKEIPVYRQLELNEIRDIAQAALADLGINDYLPNIQASRGAFINTVLINATTTEYALNDNHSFYQNVSTINMLFLKIDSIGNVQKLFDFHYCYPLHMEIVSPAVQNTDTDFLDFPYVAQTPHPKIISNYNITVFQPLISQQIPFCYFNGNVSSDEAYPLSTYYYDADNLPNGDDYGAWVSDIADEIFFPVQDNYQIRLICYPYYAAETIWRFGDLVDSVGNKIAQGILPDKNDAHKRNMSIIKIKNDNYLLGVREDIQRNLDGALFKVKSDGTVEKFDNGLKNFRLRELKRISRAKK